MGFRVNEAATEIRRGWAELDPANAFRDVRSFVAIDGHEILYGVDKGRRRQEIFARAAGKCELVLSPDCTGIAVEWAHICQEPHRNHCDCLEAGKAACIPCHRMADGNKHPRWNEA